jgi:hypothetical protein
MPCSSMGTNRRASAPGWGMTRGWLDAKMTTWALGVALEAHELVCEQRPWQKGRSPI